MNTLGAIGKKVYVSKLKTTAVAGCLFALFLVFPAVYARDISVGVYENAPKVFTGEDGKPAGIFIDVLEYIAAQEGWSITYVPGSWAEGLDRVRDGKIDLMPDTALTAQRRELFAFHSVPVLSSWHQVYAMKNSGISSILDLRQKRILVLEQSVQEDAFQRLSAGFDLEYELITVPDYDLMFEMTARGDADAAITNRFYGEMHAAEYGLEDTAIIFEPSDLYFAAFPGIEHEVLGAIDGHLNQLKRDPQSIYFRSLSRWTSRDPDFMLPRWIIVTGIVLAVILAGSLIVIYVFKKQVNTRTRELQIINNEMEHRIIERTEELERAMEKAQEADRIKSAFLATMSHELRTPLNSIIGFTGILLQELAGPLLAEQKKQLSMVQNSSRHLLALINDVLDISKIEAGQLELYPSMFDITLSLEKAAGLAAPLAEKKGLDLIFDLPAEGVEIFTDQRRLEQVVINLLNNAVTFTEKGSVILACRIEEASCCISVTDTGIGIGEAEIGNLFTPFYQVDSGLTRQKEGTGLGLSICRKIVEMMNGSISVESQKGKGSTFTIRIPTAGGDGADE